MGKAGTSQLMEKFSPSGKGGGVSYRYLSSSTSEETSSLFILEKLLMHSYITFQTHHKLDTDNAIISDWLMKTAGFIVLWYWVKPV